MRTTVFGDMIVESIDDDLGSIEVLQDAGDEIYAVISLDEEGSGMYGFEVLENMTGEGVVSSDPIFETSQDAAGYLSGWVTDIQYNFD